jgi:hypothetical protein
LAGLNVVNIRSLSLSDAIQIAAVLSAVVGTLVTVAARDTRQDAVIAELDRRFTEERELRRHAERLIWNTLRRREEEP